MLTVELCDAVASCFSGGTKEPPEPGFNAVFSSSPPAFEALLLSVSLIAGVVLSVTWSSAGLTVTLKATMILNVEGLAFLPLVSAS